MNEIDDENKQLIEAMQYAFQQPESYTGGLEILNTFNYNTIEGLSPLKMIEFLQKGHKVKDYIINEITGETKKVSFAQCVQKIVAKLENQKTQISEFEKSKE